MDNLPKLQEKNKLKNRNWKKWIIHLFPIPALAIYLIFIVYPIIAAFTYSMYEWQGIKKGDFVGLTNFINLFTLEPFNKMFWNAFQNNVIYFIFEMIVQNGIAFLLAYIIYTKIKGSEFFKVVFFLPRILSVIIVGFLWKLILNPNFGALNNLLDKIGLSDWARPWLGDPDTALLSIILVNSWFGMGFSLLIFLAGLQAIPRDVLEAAKLDGASGLRYIYSIVLPLIVPSITIVTVLTFIHAFEAFELIYAMQGSQGEPYYSTDTLAVYFYRLAFGGSSGTDSVAIGLGSALAVVLFFIIASISAIFLYFLRKKEVAQ